MDATTFISSSGSGSLAAICRRLDGLPLAIELAAVRIRMLAASIEMELDRPERAVVLATAAARHADEMGGNVSDSYFSTDVSEPARTTLGDEAYAAAEAKGRAMSILEAAEFAISLDEA